MSECRTSPERQVESADYAAAVFRKAYLREGVAGDDLVLHSDNSSPMKGATMLATLQRLGVMPSFSRPSVSDDNPYSEALFKTLKYCQAFPDKPFDNLEEARRWVAEFELWSAQTRNWEPEDIVYLNPGKPAKTEVQILQKAS